MKKLLLLVLMLSLVGFAFAQDNSALTYDGYDAATDGKIIVTAYMAGVSFSMSSTTWDLTGSALTPTQASVSGQYIIQNDGGVNIDLAFDVNADEIATGPWSPIDGVAYTTWADYPATDEYFMTLLVQNVGDGAPAEADFETNGLLGAGYQEASTALFDGGYANTDANGLNIPAYDPTNAATGDQVEIYLLFIAPGSATNPGTALDPHTFQIDVNASLSS